MQDIIPFIHEHAALTTALVGILLLLILLEFIKQQRGARALSPTLATQLINHSNALVIDIRSTEAFASGHIVGALSIPVTEWAAKEKKLDKHKSQPLLLVCATGADSRRIAANLLKKGFNVQLLAGGIQHWRTADMPLIKD